MKVMNIVRNTIQSFLQAGDDMQYDASGQADKNFVLFPLVCSQWDI